MRKLAFLPFAALAFYAGCSDNPAGVGSDRAWAPADPLLAGVAGASYTTTNPDYDGAGTCFNGPGLVNCNIYTDKAHVWINGGPTNGTRALSDGLYFFVVLEPGGENSHLNDFAPPAADKNLSDEHDSFMNRRFEVSGNHISAYVPDTDAGTSDHVFDHGKIRLALYSTTTNPGGEYAVGICRLGDVGAAVADYAYPAQPAACKYDNFKVKETTAETPEVEVEKTAVPYFARAHRWDIAKTGDASTVSLPPGQSRTVNYTVTVTHTGQTDSDFEVSGKIKVTNKKNVPATINSVSDATDFGPADNLTCPAFPVTLQNQGDFFECDYDQALSKPPVVFGTSYENTATAFVDDPASATDLQFVGVASFLFDGNAPGDETDECVDVSDTYAGSPVSGTVCAADSPKEFKYSRTFGPARLADCNTTRHYPNTAALETNDTGATDDASWNVDVTAVCGCTPGYWKNNTAGWSGTGFTTSTLEKVPFPSSDNATFFWLKGKTLGSYTMLQGLGFQGNSTVEGGGEILLRAGTAALLNASKFGYPLTPTQVKDQVDAALASHNRATMIALAGTLDGYNNLGCPLNAKGIPINP